MIPPLSLRRDDFRFELQPCAVSHGSGLAEAAVESRNEVGRWMAWLHAGYGLKDADDWIAYSTKAWDAESEFEFVIYDRQEKALAGACGLNNLNRKDLVANLGYWVRTSKVRLGAATQAVLLLQEFGFATLRFNRLEIVVAEGNEPSRGVAQKVGAFYEGRQRRRVKVGDKVYDGHMYALVQPRS